MRKWDPDFGQKEELIFLGREISEQRDYSEKTALQIDSEVTALISQAYESATKILTENKERLIHLAQVLIVKENLEGEELEAAFNEPVTTPIPPVSIPNTTPTPVPPSASKPSPLPPPANTNPATNPLSP